MTASIRHGYARTHRGEMHFSETGDGEVLLLLHATPRSHRYFRHALPQFGKRYRTLAVDTPGFGNSHPLPAGATMRTLAECFVAFMDAIGIERAHLVGLHTGNKIAAALAAEWPSRVGRVVLCGQTHSLVLEKAGRDDAIRNIVDHYFPKYAQVPEGSHWIRQWAAAGAEVNKLAWPLQLKTGASVSAEDVDIARMHVLDYLQGWQSIVPIYEAIFAFDMAADLRRIVNPALVLELATAHEMHLGAQAQRLCDVMKDANAATVQADGEVFEIRPQACVAPIVNFLG
jgi:pimeloyl-ACP methyl ester carboxylesterase